MASFSDTVKIVVDVVTSGATSGLNDVKGKVAEAEGGFGKLKAGATGAMQSIGVGASTLALGAGAAIGGFVAKGIGDFEDLALAAQNFSTVAGTTVQDASRWIEVAGDLGVETDTVQGAMQRLNREAEQGKLKQFGIDATNANDRLIQSVQYLAGIKDETQRSQAAFEMFGKSSASLAPLIASAGELKDRMAEVSGAKLISEQNIEDARKFRDDMDRVTDAVDNLILSAGKIALPIVDSLTEIAGPLAEIIEKLAEVRAAAVAKADTKGSSWFDDLKGMLGRDLPSTFEFFLNKIDEVTGGTGDRFGKAGDAALKFGDIVEAQGKKFVVLGDVTKDVTGMTDDQVRALISQDKSLQTSGASARAGSLTQEEMDKALKATNERLAAQSKALGDLMKAQQDQQSAQLASIDSEVGYNRAVEDVGTALGEYQQKGADAEAATKKYGAASDEATKATKALDDTTRPLEDSISKAAAAADQYAQDQANATGRTYDTADSVAAQIGALNELKAKFPELAPAIDAHIAKLNAIPVNKDTEITVHAEGLDHIIDQMNSIRDKTVHVNAVGSVNVHGTEAGGGPIDTTAMYLVGEEGPEIVVLPNGAYVHTASETKGLRGMAGGGIVGNAQMEANWKNLQAEKADITPAERTALLEDLNNVLKALASVDPADVAKVAKFTDQVAAIRSQLHTSGVYTPTGGPAIVPGASQGLTFTKSEMDKLYGTPLSEMKNAPPPAYRPVQTPWTPGPGQSMFDSPYFQSDFWKPGQGRGQSESEIAANRQRANSAALARADAATQFPVHIENLTVNMPPGSNGDDIVQALKRYQRRNGTIPITTLR